MAWFGWKAAGRGDPRPALTHGHWLFAGGDDVPQGYEPQVRAGYCRNAVAQRAVRIVAEAAASAPLRASDPAITALIATRSGGQALIEVAATQLLLHGNAYLQLLSDPAGQVREIFALRPERVTVEPDAAGWPVAYSYRAAGRKMRLIADGPRPEVAHVRLMHPLDDHYGLGCLGAAAEAIALHNAAARWNRALIDNAARPSGALVYDPGDGSVMTREQFQRLRAEMEASFAGAGNAGRPMLLEGGLKWQALSLTPADLDFARSRDAAAREIALAFGVPPMLIGLPGDNSYANYKEANRALWRLTVLPLLDTLLSAIGQALRGWYEGASVAVDLDRVLALAEDRERLWRSVAAADFLSDAEKRAMVGLAPEAGGMSEVLAQLIAQARDAGGDMTTLRAIAEEAGELGATRALTRLGLADDSAPRDVAELRELLGAWRVAKQSAWRALVGWVFKLAGAVLLGGLAVKLGVGERLK